MSANAAAGEPFRPRLAFRLGAIHDSHKEYYGIFSIMSARSALCAGQAPSTSPLMPSKAGSTCGGSFRRKAS